MDFAALYASDSLISLLFSKYMKLPPSFPTSAVIRSRRICRLFLQTILNRTEMRGARVWGGEAGVKKNTFQRKSWQHSATLMLHHSCFCLNPARSHLLKNIASLPGYNLWAISLFDGLKEWKKSAASWLIFIRIREKQMWAFISEHRPSWNRHI